MLKSLLESGPMSNLHPRLARPIRRWVWERKWRTRDRFPWKATQPPSELVAAIESSWLAEGMSVLDLGCGDGDNAAWLAERGFRVHGIDFSECAISRARDTHRDVASLTFETVDVCVDGAMSGRTFEAVVDRGCLHVVPDQLQPVYARNVAAWARPAAPFLLTMNRAGRDEEPRKEFVERLLGEFFRIEDVCEMEDMVGHGPRVIPGVAFRLRRIKG